MGTIPRQWAQKNRQATVGPDCRCRHRVQSINGEADFRARFRFALELGVGECQLNQIGSERVLAKRKRCATSRVKSTSKVSQATETSQKGTSWPAAPGIRRGPRLHLRGVT